MMRQISAKLLSFLLVTLLLASLSGPALASDSKQSVKIGYMEQPGFIEHNTRGELVGYGVDYFQEICSYINWEIEYVPVSWEDQFDKLEKGELDIVTLVPYDEELTDRFAFSRESMGLIRGILLVEQESTEIYFEDFSSLDGKTIGIEHGSRIDVFLREYARLNSFSYFISEYDSYDDMKAALQKNDIQAIAVDETADIDGLRIVGHFGSGQCFLLFNKDDTELIDQLDRAMDEMFSVDSDFRSKLYDKYFGACILKSHPAFTREETEYISSVKEQTIALLSDTQPGAYLDKNGNAAGIVPDILDLVSEICGLHFNYTFVPLGTKPLDHMLAHPELLLGGVLSFNPAFKENDVLLSDSFYMGHSALVKKSLRDQYIDIETGNYKIGMVQAFQAMQLYIRDNYPNLEVVSTYRTVNDGLEALKNGEIDLFTYELNMILHYWGNPHFKNMEFMSTSFLDNPQCVAAMNDPENSLLISIINKCIAAIPAEEIAHIERVHLSQNSYQLTFSDMLYKVRIQLLLAVLLIALILSFFLIDRSKNKKNEEIVRQNNIQLAAAAERAEHANSIKTEFLSRMSHDIRTPMNAIMGMTELMKNEIGGLPKASEYLEKIQAASNILLRLLNDILDSTAIERGKLKIAHEPFDLNRELLTLTNVYAAQCAEKGVYFFSDCGDIENVLLAGDSLRLSQILMNLLSNACKFTEAGGSITLTAKETSHTDREAVFRFTISDTGCGMEEEMLMRLFEPFEQKDATIAHRYGGSGLGLNIVNNLVSMMGGTINVESKPGVGTTFNLELTFEIDTRTSDDRTAERSVPGRAERAFDFSGRHILIADDDAFNREVVTGLLEAVNARVDSVEDGEKALAAFLSSAPGDYDAIILDIHMPAMDGYTTVKMIRSSPHPDAKTIPLFALTADAFPEDIERSASLGMTGHLTKPIYPQELYKALADVFVV